MNIWLGKTVKDAITGFVGVVTGHVEYLTGCNQCLVQPGVTLDGSWTESQWIDDHRLSVVSETAPVLSAQGSGSDKAAPKR
mgnify:CR=1 FL=1